MLDQLRKIFGEDIQSVPYEFPNHTPIYIRDGYTAQKLLISGSSCILITPLDPNIHLPALKKQYENIQKISDDPVVLSLPYLTAVQRRNLIETHIPFLSLPYQVYLPFWGCFFSNRFNTPGKINVKMPAAAQMVYLYLLYRGRNDSVMIKDLINALSLSKAGGTRAIKALAEFGLIDQKREGTSKQITLAADSLPKAIKLMESPIQKTLYLRTVPVDIPYKYGGLWALSMKTMITSLPHDGSIVISRESARKIPEALRISAAEFNDLGGILTEIWTYDPFSLSLESVVDPLSLLLTLQDSEDERIQKELDTIRNKYDL